MKINKKEHAYNDIKQQVLTLNLLPGSALDEVDFSDRYGLSRTPMREVFQRLSGDGYVSLENQRGAFVSSMELETMRSFFQTAPMIYAAVARLATEQATAEQIAALKKTQLRFTNSIKQNAVTDMAMFNHRFHEQLGKMAASPYLSPSHGRLLIDHTRMAQRFYHTSQAQQDQRIGLACEQHDAMIESIAARTPAVTVELTLAHWELSRHELDKYVLPDPLPLDESIALPAGN